VASKPNILNVTLTRAKRRFYMVGDRSLWTRQQFFFDAARALPTGTEEDFMHRVNSTWNARLSCEKG
jgi:hypothetical protein